MSRSYKLLYTLLFLPLVVVVYLVFPEESFAWGPGVHIKISLEILDTIQKIAPAIADIITRHPFHYLYGSISPDIIIGKRYAREVDHCHNWEVGQTIMSMSGTDEEKAFAYGYLSHLAADSVAHNYFVPNQLISNFAAKTLRHAYWEMRFDGLMEKSIWDVFNKIPREVRRENNKKLKMILTTTLFSFNTNKNIFNGIMRINRISKWREMIRNVSDKSQWTLTKRDVNNYYKLTLNSVSELLCSNGNALCMNADPNGRDSLKVAKKVRKDLKVLNKLGRLTEYDKKRIINELKPQFIRKITSRDKIKHTIKLKAKIKA